jgi:hypothetical protein
MEYVQHFEYLANQMRDVSTPAQVAVNVNTEVLETVTLIYFAAVNRQLKRRVSVFKYHEL